MLKKQLLFILLILPIGHLSAQTLTVRIENADIGRGYLMIGVFNDESSFPSDHYRGERVVVSDRTMTVTFYNLPIGQYAVSVFQDSNNNGRLDTNFLGIPSEKYGFSNGTRRPNFNDSSFDFSGNMTITIRIR